MKKFLVFISVFILLGFPVLMAQTHKAGKAKTTQAVITRPVNIQKSYIAWTGKKVLGQHSGKVNVKSGTINAKNGLLAGGNFEIDMTSIKDTDLTDADYNKKLITHLSSEDFFNVAAYPTATLKLTKVLKLTNKVNSYNVTGDLTIKGITKSVTFPATFKAVGKVFEGIAKLTIDRTLWDIKYGSSNFFEGLGDKAIKNDIELNVHVVSN